jgi:hypothetical protein
MNRFLEYHCRQPRQDPNYTTEDQNKILIAHVPEPPDQKSRYEIIFSQSAE